MCEITKENDSLQRQTENKDEDSQKIQGNKNIPELRFPEFEGEWITYKLCDVVTRIIRKNKNLETKRPLTISAKYGLIDQIEFFDKYVASKNLKGYYLLKKGEFAYNKSYSNGFPYGAVKRLDLYNQGAISTLYICFEITNKINSNFLKIYFDSNKWNKEMYKIAVEGARNHGLLNIPINDFFNTKHLFPSISEQEKIADFLSAIDKKIGFMEKKHTLYQSIKKYFLENLFPHDSKIPYLRLPMFSDEFKRFTLNELFISKKGKGLSKDKIQEDGENKCILYGELYTTYSQIISTIKSRTNIFEGVLSNKMDILMPCSTTTTGKDLATASVLLKENVLLGGDITILRKKKDILDEIYFAYYLSFCLNKTLTSLAQGSTIIHLYWNHIKNIEVLIPSKEEQIQIAKIIKLLDDKIEQSSLQINNLKDYKKGLLQKMFV